MSIGKLEAPWQDSPCLQVIPQGCQTGLPLPGVEGFAARAAELPVTRGRRGIYNVTEGDGAVSSDKAIRHFGWSASWRADGMAA